MASAEHRLIERNGKHSKLTARETECLHWTAAGKTSWEISIILQRSQATINFHLQHACRKLDAVNKCEAAVKAQRLGLIVLEEQNSF